MLRNSFQPAPGAPDRRRFLLDVLPDHFMRIRHFGFLANRAKKQALTQCRRLLKLDPALPEISNRPLLLR